MPHIVPRLSKYLLPRPRQRESVLHGVEAGEPRRLGAAGEAGALPDFAIGERRQPRVHHRVAGADAAGVALRAHLESMAPIQLAIARAGRPRTHLADVAAERRAAAVIIELAGDILRRRLEADQAVLRGCGG